ncbi:MULTISPECIES: hypothetical protein [unclassified Psychrobacter]|uniref:hypothetical protein n=1 Tax=unclassified Psychrobacter TaxID=196806 RepID=UPI00071E6B8E|nr:MULTISPECIES: hypothetical protein [unclassified Psychrobacter]OLF37665.1 hypothetical protein BTV98_08700 [Psychrobacter sp. Cmf 22.2]
MNLGQLKQLRTTVFMTGLLAGAISISACQQQQEPEPSLEDSINAEESVPMSAEPADPNDTIVATDDASLNEVEDDTVANVNTDLNQITYLCTPALEVEATYKDDANQVVIGTDMGTVTLAQTNEGTNPEVFEVDTAMDGGQGFTQWRVAHGERETGVMRTAGEDEADISTYECNKT